MKKQQWLSHPSWWKSCDFPPLRNQMCTVKGSVSRDVIPLFFSWFEPIWATDKQAKVFSNYCSISPRYSITKLCAAHCGGKFFLHKKEKTHDFPIQCTPFFPPPHFWRIITQVFMREYSTHWPWADASPASGHPPSAGHPVLPHPASPAQELSWPHSSGFGILSLSSISRSDKTFFNWQKRRRKNCCSTIKKELFLSITGNIIIWSRHQTISGSG